jgi:hypothetical protein
MASNRERQAVSGNEIKSDGREGFPPPDPENGAMGQLFTEKSPRERNEGNPSDQMTNCLVAFNHVYRSLKNRPSKVDANRLTEIMIIGGREVITASPTTPNYENRLRLARHLAKEVAEKSATLTNKNLHHEATSQVELLEILAGRKEKALSPDQELFKASLTILNLLDRANERANEQANKQTNKQANEQVNEQEDLNQQKDEKRGNLTETEKEELQQALITLTAAGLQVDGDRVNTFLTVVAKKLRQYRVTAIPVNDWGKRDEEIPSHLKRTLDLLIDLGKLFENIRIKKKAKNK